MTMPLSATVKSWSTVRREHGEGDPDWPLRTLLSSSPVPRMPPTKSIRLSVRGSAIAEDRGQEVFLEDRDVEGGDRVGRVVRAGARLRARTTPVEEHAEFPAFTGALWSAGRRTKFRRPGQEAPGCQPVEVRDDAIVREDFTWLCGKITARKIIVLFAPGGPRVCLVALHLDASRGRRTVVPVGDVEEIERRRTRTWIRPTRPGSSTTKKM